MKIDELISELKQVREEHGNLSVIIPYNQAGDVEKLDVGDLEVDLKTEKSSYTKPENGRDFVKID